MIRGITLGDLPTITQVQSVELQPTDVLVFELPYPASPEALADIQKVVEFMWPGRKAIVLDNGAKLKVVQG